VNRPLARETRAGLLVASCLALVAGLQLYVGTEQTDRYFAWTIEPPLSAAFLGAMYFTALVLLFLASRERIWAAARVTLISSLVLVTLLLVTTLVHIGRFHTDSSSILTLVGTWAFVAAYVLLPLLLAACLVHQHRLPGGDPPRTAPLPAWARAVLALQATVMLVAGVALLCAPAATAGIWPWTLTPLMGRAAASWLIAIGLAAALALWENDWWRIRVPLAGYTVLAILQLVALARYSDTPEWASLQAVVYLAVLASMLVLGVVGYPIARRSGNIQLPGVLSSGNGETIERNAQCEASPSKRSC